MTDQANQHQLSVNHQRESKEGQSVSNMSNSSNMSNTSDVSNVSNDERMNEISSVGDDHENRDEQFMDIDRMVNEGLGGGMVTMHNGLIEHTTTDTMDEPESVLDA